ncbi:hypothetical protein DL96DRAFT_1678213 [Flagelloscypha sp. PMI_526]|nr:hypothetical protein DL96DRAFT_1678213 [Flagelloscypha sp. PMI_526]
MFLPSFFVTLVLALHSVDAQTIFRNGNTQLAVTKIRLGTDFANAGADGNIPADATKGLSVSTNIIAPVDAPAIAQVIANANAQTDAAAKKAGLAQATKLLKALKPIGLNPTATWQAQFSDTTFPGFALKPDGNKDPGHSLLVVTTPISKDTIQNTLNDGRFTILTPDTVFNMVLQLGGNPAANIQPATGSGTNSNPAAPPVKPGVPPVTPGTPPVKPPTGAPPVLPPVGVPVKPPTGVPPVKPPTGVPPVKPPVLPPTLPVKPPTGVPPAKPPTGVPPVRPPTIPVRPPTLPVKPATPPAAPKTGKIPRSPEESLRMRRVRRSLA